MPNSLYIACQPWDCFIKCYCTYFAAALDTTTTARSCCTFPGLHFV